MLRVAEQYSATDTGLQRRANEDALLAHAPLFVVADGMGGAQAGEVASRIAVDVFRPGLEHPAEPERALAALARAANTRIHELSHANAEHAGMGTTLTAVYVGEHDVAIAHVGDSRAYCLRDGELLRLTDDHTLVDELLRQGRLTPEEAVEHPQRSVITRALGPEGAVEVDTRSCQARARDVFLLCSDGLTTMISEQQIRDLLVANPRLADAGEALIAAANAAGGRDNVTVVLLRVEEVHALDGAPADVSAATDTDTDTGEHETTAVDLPAVVVGGTNGAAAASGDGVGPGATSGASGATEDGAVTAGGPRATSGTAGATAGGAATRARRTPSTRRLPRPGPRREPDARRRRRLRIRHAKAILVTLAVLAVIVVAVDLALQNVYFIGTDGRGLVTLYQGLPYQLPGNIDLYSRQYVSGVSASRIPPARRKTLLAHHLRTEANAASLIRSLELEQLQP